MAGVASGAVWWTLGFRWRVDLASLAGNDLPAAFSVVASLAALAVAAWILLVLTLTVATPSVGRRMAPRVVHRAFIRRAVAAGAIGALSFAPAHADSGQATNPTRPLHALDGLRLPDRPAAVSVVAPPRVLPSSTPQVVITVRAGDTLWGIAARHLPPNATTSEIAEATARWYRANRTTIGSDPDLIQPEQVLTSPKDRS